MTSPPLTSAEIRAALAEPSVVREVTRAVRDARMRAAFAQLRSEGVSVDEAVEQLRGPHVDEKGRRYFLADETVRGVVYPRKRNRR
jgi:hypothetical protein